MTQSSGSEFSLLLCVVKNEEAVEDILTGFLELGVGGATVINAHGMAEIISSQMPLFAGFRDVFKAGGSSRIILAAMPTSFIQESLDMIERLTHGEKSPGKGVAFAVPVAQSLGLSRQVLDED